MPIAITSRGGAKPQGALADKLDLQLYDGNFLLPPGAVTTGSGTPYKIYTPFSKATLEQFPPRDALPEPDTLSSPDKWPDSDNLDDWELLPTQPDWAGGMRDFWEVGSDAAFERLEWWDDHVEDYDEGRNLPSQDTSSRLSPHLHFGEISPVQIWHALQSKSSAGWKTFEKELIWRDYAQNVICQFPSYPIESYRDGFAAMQWARSGSGLRRSNRPQGLAAGPHRISHCRCWDAAVVADRMDAQQGSHDRCQFPHQTSADRLAAWRDVVLGHAG